MKIARALWPKLLRDIADEIGDELALLLSNKVGGQRLYVPGKLGDSATVGENANTAAARKRLVALIGEELAAHLEESHGGEDIYVPRFTARIAEERRKFVLQNPHLTANHIAAELGVSVRRVEQIREELRAPSTQGSLFG